MTQSRRDADYSRLEDVQVRKLRRSPNGNFLVGGYVPGNAGRPRPHPGDEKFPFIKDPPDLLPPVRYIEPVELSLEGSVQNPIPNVTQLSDYFVLDPIDVRGYRLATTFIEFYPGAEGPGGVLSMVPEVSIDVPVNGAETWFPIGVVDAVITASTTLNCGGYRETYATELRFSNGGVTTPQFCRETLVFDVGPYERFRLRVGDINTAASGVNLYYTLQR